MNRKGAEMTIGTIVIIVLALIVLVVVALGFTTGWKNLWSKVNVFSGGNNLATVGQACSIACEAGDVNGWCYVKREWKNEKKELKSGTCHALSSTAGVDGQKIAECGDTDVTLKCPTPPTP